MISVPKPALSVVDGYFHSETLSWKPANQTKRSCPNLKVKLKGPEKNAIAEGLFNYLRVLCASVVKWVLRKIQ